MRPRHIFLVVPALAILTLVGTSCAFEYTAQRRSAALWEKVHRAAPTGATREQVEQSLQSQGLPFKYSPSSNAIFGPWIPVGRYRLLWETQFYYEVNLDSNGRVQGFTTKRFNEGL